MEESTKFKKTLRESFSIMVIITIMAFGINIIHPKGYSLISSADLKKRSIVNISAIEAGIKYNNSSAIFIDSRSSSEYREKHIKGSINIPASPESGMLGAIKRHYKSLKSMKELVLYCNGKTCGSDRALAEKILEMGYERHIYIIENGIPEWTKHGLPVEEIKSQKE